MESVLSPGIRLLALALFVMSLGGMGIWMIGHVWLLVRGFREGPGWGVCILLFPLLADLLFSLEYWVVAKKPFILSLIGGFILLIAFGGQVLFAAFIKPPQAMAPDSAKSRAPAAAPASSLEDMTLVNEPSTDHEKVAGMLKDAGIDPNDPHTFHGRTIEEMTKALGAPSATLKAGRKITFIFYNCFEVVSSDGGRTVSAVHYMGK